MVNSNKKIILVVVILFFMCCLSSIISGGSLFLKYDKKDEPATSPPSDASPPATSPPTTSPPVSSPPVSSPPVSSPPVSSPPVSSPPTTSPPAASPPVASPPSDASPPADILPYETMPPPPDIDCVGKWTIGDEWDVYYDNDQHASRVKYKITQEKSGNGEDCKTLVIKNHTYDGQWDEVVVKDGDEYEFLFKNPGIGDNKVIKDEKDILTIVRRDPQDHNLKYCIREKRSNGEASGHRSINGRICHAYNLPSYLKD